VDYVLGRFLPEEIPIMREAVITAAAAAEEIVTDGIDAAMNRYNISTKHRNETNAEEQSE
jgi:PTH1 family peptidyl-tRNA hydrolase